MKRSPAFPRMSSIPLLLAALLIMKGVLGQRWNVSYGMYSLAALDHTNILIPCTFEYPRSKQIKKIMWTKNHTIFVYNMDEEQIDPFYKGRTLYLGDNDSNCTLQITNLRLEDTGDYRFILLIDENYYTGPRMRLIVTENVCLTSIDSPSIFEEEKAAKLICSVLKPSGPIPFWYYSNLTYIQRQSHSKSNRDAILKLMPSKKDNNRLLLCWRAGCPVKELKMNVLYRPHGVQLSSTPQILSPLDAGQNVILRCEVSSSNPPVIRYSWYKGVRKLWKPIQDYLFLENITASDSGKYHCKAHNEIGHSSSQRVVIRVACSSCASPFPVLPAAFGAVAAVLVLLAIGIGTFLYMRNRKRGEEPRSASIITNIYNYISTLTLPRPWSQTKQDQAP